MWFSYIMAVVALMVITSSNGQTRLASGTYGGLHWNLGLNMDPSSGLVNGTIEGDCSIGTVSALTEGSYSADTGTPVNMTLALTLQYGDMNASNTITVSDGILAPDNMTLTGTFSTNENYTEAFTMVLNQPADLYKCVAGVSQVTVGWIPLLLLSCLTMFTQ